MLSLDHLVLQVRSLLQMCLQPHWLQRFLNPLQSKYNVIFGNSELQITYHHIWIMPAIIQHRTQHTTTYGSTMLNIPTPSSNQGKSLAWRTIYRKPKLLQFHLHHCIFHMNSSSRTAHQSQNGKTKVMLVSVLYISVFWKCRRVSPKYSYDIQRTLWGKSLLVSIMIHVQTSFTSVFCKREIAANPSYLLAWNLPGKLLYLGRVSSGIIGWCCLLWCFLCTLQPEKTGQAGLLLRFHPVLHTEAELCCNVHFCALLLQTAHVILLL